MTKTNTLRFLAPARESAALFVASLAALCAAEIGAGVYAAQSAASAQALWGIPTDAILKTALSVTAGLGVAFGAPVTAWLFRTGRKGLRGQAWLAALMTALALVISASNLSGYFAWTRGQAEAEAVQASMAYRTAARLQARREAGEAVYIRREDEAVLRSGEPPADAERELGDIVKAFGVHLLILGFGAYRLPAQRKAPARKRKPAAKGKPNLRAVG